MFPERRSAQRRSAQGDLTSIPGDQLVRRTLTFVMAGGRGTRLHELTDFRAKPALPFAGKLRLIDFPLSNCFNSGLRRIAVLTQYKSQSLIRHVERGWGFLSQSPGEFVDIVPAQQQLGDDWYRGTADALYQNLNLVNDTDAELVLILAGDHVYKMNYAIMLAEHVARGADVTVACIDVPLSEAVHFGVMQVDDNARVVAFEEKPADPRSMPGAPDRALASMGIYVFNAAVLARELTRDAEDSASSHDFGKDLIPRLLGRCRVVAHRFADSCVNVVDDQPYWRDVGTIDAYWAASLDLTSTVPELNLYDKRWPILSLQAQLPPAKFVFDEDGRRGMAINSLVAGGSIVSGAVVRRSVISSHVRVDEGSTIEDSVVLPEVTIGRHVILRRVVVDKYCEIPDGLEAGVDAHADRARFRVSPGGVVLITRAMLGQTSWSAESMPAQL